ncbi:PA2928 family protein [Actinosynnema sp. CS-041913]|uniref:PA2928 family protein n=1 Tax=Actinosynnema sp. CS-041913 TaxID=3239917 RepID=UPI003D92901F
MMTKIPDGMYPPYQTPTPYLPVEPYGSPRRVRRSVPLLFLLPLVLFAGLFFGGSYLVSPEPDVEVQADIGVASANGRDVLLLPYERHGPRGMFQLMFQDMFQVRLAATDAATGELLWDTQLADDLVWQASVLAAGERYAYVATDAGLVVLDLADGSKVAEGKGIEGLGDAFVAARWSYRYDPDNRRVMTMSGTGAVLAIPLDSATATPVDPQTSATWAGALSERTFPDTRPSTVTKAGVRDGRVELRPRPGGAPGQVLVRITPGGEEVQVGDVTFHEAGLLADGTAAAGFASDHVMVVHSRHVNDKDRALSAVSLATGAVTGSVPIDHSSFSRPATRANGATAVGTGSAVAVLTPDGRLTARPVGASDFFGNPS